jgi:hypothetical protein
MLINGFTSVIGYILADHGIYISLMVPHAAMQPPTHQRVSPRTPASALTISPARLGCSARVGAPQNLAGTADNFPRSDCGHLGP